MRVRLIALLSILLLLPAGATLVARADVGYTQQVVLKDEAPESGRFAIRYKNYREKVRVGCLKDGYCDGMYYRKAEGKLQVKLSTYRIKEGRRRFDYYVLDVDTLNADREGTSEAGWFAVLVRHKGARFVDYVNTKSSSFDDDRDCREIGVGLATPWPIVSASMDLGHVRFCDEGARYSHKGLSGNTSEYFAGNARDVVHVSNQRVVKVRRGDQPVFVVTVKYPTDDCTSTYNGHNPSFQGYCDDYDNEVSTRTFRIGTRG